MILDDTKLLLTKILDFVKTNFSSLYLSIFNFQYGQNMSRQNLYLKCSRGSHSSDTSSAYSGSDTMASTHSELEGDELDLTGLVESIVDSDEEDDLAESMDVSKIALVSFPNIFYISQETHNLECFSEILGTAHETSFQLLLFKRKHNTFKSSLILSIRISSRVWYAPIHR